MLSAGELGYDVAVEFVGVFGVGGAAAVLIRPLDHQRSRTRLGVGAALEEPHLTKRRKKVRNGRRIGGRAYAERRWMNGAIDERLWTDGERQTTIHDRNKGSTANWGGQTD